MSGAPLPPGAERPPVCSVQGCPNRSVGVITAISQEQGKEADLPICDWHRRMLYRRRPEARYGPVLV